MYSNLGRRGWSQVRNPHKYSHYATMHLPCKSTPVSTKPPKIHFRFSLIWPTRSMWRAYKRLQFLHYHKSLQIRTAFSNISDRLKLTEIGSFQSTLKNHSVDCYDIKLICVKIDAVRKWINKAIQHSLLKCKSQACFVLRLVDQQPALNANNLWKKFLDCRREWMLLCISS